MNQNKVKDTRESPNKQQTGILNRLPIFSASVFNNMLISFFFHLFQNSTDVKSGLLLHFLMERLVGMKYLFSQKGRFALKNKNLLMILYDSK